MKNIEFYVTMKVSCSHDDAGYWADATPEEIKENALHLLTPNYHSVENGTSLKGIEIEYHADSDINNDMWDFCPDMIIKE